MPHPDPGADRAAQGAVLLGPGARLGRLAGWLERLGAGPPWRRLADLGALLGPLDGARVLVLDLDELSLEDLGLPLRALARHPELELRLVGTDPGSSAARRLLARPGAAWLPWPLDLEQLELLAPAPSEAEERGGPRGPAPQPRAPERGTAGGPGPAAAPRAPAEDDIRRQVEDILGAGRPGGSRTLGATRAAAALTQPQLERGPERGPEPGPEPARDPALPAAAPWFKDQVADLADVVQRAELGHAQLRAAAEGAVGGDLEERLARLGEEFARLVQFTRTLGYLVAPPAPGAQRIELGGQLEAQLRAMRADPGCPRFLFRAAGDAWVRSERALLTEAFDALLTLAQLCAGPEGTVRLEVRREGEAQVLETRIRFAPGPLSSLALERIQAPYGLRRVLPELGPNSLAAARGILEGQGGQVELLRLEDGDLEWRVRLPAA